MALTTQPKAAAYVGIQGGGSAPIDHGIEKASSSWKAGAFLIDDTPNGTLTISTTPIDVGAVARRTFGFALADATGTTGHDVPFIRIRGDAIFEITLSDLSAGTHTLAQGDLYKTLAITKGTTNWYLDANAVSDAGGGHIIGFKDPVGTVDARVYCLVTATALGAADASSGVI